MASAPPKVPLGASFRTDSVLVATAGGGADVDEARRIFQYCGRIEHVRKFSPTDQVDVFYITFETEDGASEALKLSGRVPLGVDGVAIVSPVPKRSRERQNGHNNGKECVSPSEDKDRKAGTDFDFEAKRKASASANLDNAIRTIFALERRDADLKSLSSSTTNMEQKSNTEGARVLLVKAAVQGNALAAFVCLFKGWSSRQVYLSQLLRMATKGNAFAEYLLGGHYLWRSSSETMSAKIAQAEPYFRGSAEKGFVPAASAVGDCKRLLEESQSPKGDSSLRHLVDAKMSPLYWYQRGMDGGYPRAYAHLAYCYQFGICGIEKNLKTAVKLYKEASEKGCRIGRICLNRLREHLIFTQKFSIDGFDQLVAAGLSPHARLAVNDHDLLRRYGYSSVFSDCVKLVPTHEVFFFDGRPEEEKGLALKEEKEFALKEEKELSFEERRLLDYTKHGIEYTDRDRIFMRSMINRCHEVHCPTELLVGTETLVRAFDVDALLVACIFGRDKVVRHLIQKHSVDIMQQYHGYSLLQFIIVANGAVDESVLCELIEAKADINHTADGGSSLSRYTPVMLAAAAGNFQTVKLLIGHGAALHHAYTCLKPVPKVPEKMKVQELISRLTELNVGLPAMQQQKAFYRKLLQRHYRDQRRMTIFSMLEDAADGSKNPFLESKRQEDAFERIRQYVLREARKRALQRDICKLHMLFNDILEASEVPCCSSKSGEGPLEESGFQGHFSRDRHLQILRCGGFGSSGNGSFGDFNSKSSGFGSGSGGIGAGFGSSSGGFGSSSGDFDSGFGSSSGGFGSGFIIGGLGSSSGGFGSGSSAFGSGSDAFGFGGGGSRFGGGESSGAGFGGLSENGEASESFNTNIFNFNREASESVGFGGGGLESKGDASEDVDHGGFEFSVTKGDASEDVDSGGFRFSVTHSGDAGAGEGRGAGEQQDLEEEEDRGFGRLRWFE